MIPNTTDLFINEQQPIPLSRNKNSIQASRLATEQSRKTGVLTPFYSNHESESLIQTAPVLYINELQNALPQNINTLQPSRLEVTTRKAFLLTKFNGNHESESLIQNAPEFINNQQLALISRNITIVQASRIAAATTRKTVLLNKGTSNHESESLIQNAPT